MVSKGLFRCSLTQKTVRKRTPALLHNQNMRSTADLFHFLRLSPESGELVVALITAITVKWLASENSTARKTVAYLQFLGAAGTVTGSKHLINTRDDSSGKQGLQVLIDCGLFQGAKEWRVRN